MSNKKSTSLYMRVVHRYLGFFLAGIMTVYALSGVILIFRETSFLKIDKQIEKQLQPNVEIAEICTKCSSNFYSYRNGNDGRIAVFIEKK